jgi:hypothetical protein
MMTRAWSYLLVIAAAATLLAFGLAGATPAGMWSDDTPSEPGGVSLPGDGEWDSRFALPGPSHRPSVMAADSTHQLYIGGSFDSLDGLPISTVARWDGDALHVLGSGIPSGSVRAIAIDGEGNLYAGGRDLEVNGSTAAVAKWDGQAWSVVAAQSDPSYSVEALVVDSQGVLYAGGFFTSLDGQDLKYLPRRDGQAWTAVGNAPDDGLYALAVDEKDVIYAGGAFTKFGSTPAPHVARWNGTDWDQLGNGLYPGSSLRALAVGPDHRVCA